MRSPPMTSENGSSRRLLPVVIDETARASPDKVFAITPRTRKLQDGFAETTYAQVARAVNKLAWWLDEKLGVCSHLHGIATVAYIGPRDLRYAILVVAAMKTNRQVLLPLAQNSVDATVHLIKETKPEVLLRSTEMPSVWDGVRSAKLRLRVSTLPELAELCRDTPVKLYPYTKTWEQARNDPIHINHSSDTKGLPTPVPWTNAVGATFARDREAAASAPEGKRLAHTLLADRKIIVTVAPDWIAGLLLILHFPAFLDTVPVLLPADAASPPTAAYLDAVHRMLPDADGGFYVPAALEQLVASPKYLANMAHLKLAAVAGAALDPAAGDRLHAFLRVQPLLATTAVGPLPLLESDALAWDHLRFDAAHPAGARLLPYDADAKTDMYELVIARQRLAADFQPVFRRPGHESDDQVHRTGLVFEPHPDPAQAGVWLPVGRARDFVRLANGTSFNAPHVEALITEHPSIAAAVLGGDGRKRPFVLVQLTHQDERERRAVVDEIWPAFERVNRFVAPDARLRRELVVFCRPERPVRWGVGGGVRRFGTLADYQKEIQRVYAGTDWA